MLTGRDGETVSGPSAFRSAEPPALDVDQALAVALERASAAGEWSVVATLAGELQARRLAAAGVPELGAERARRGRP